jgi:cell division protein FtsI/penicillin-binding protein 2
VQVGHHNLDCQHVRTVEAMNAERALAYSCNDYFTQMGLRLTGEQMSSAFRTAGLGSPTHLVASEASGSLQSAATREGAQLMAVGEYGLSVTSLQMAEAYRRLAMQAKSPDESMKVLLAGMRGAINYGTAQGAQVPGLEVAGKTGTSTAEEGPWTHAWFAGFAPAANPEIVIVVFLESGHGSEAADIAGTILKAYARGSR